MKKIIEVVPYDPNWPNAFEKEATLIRQALGGNCLAIHHIGSTSVPGLGAKPIIDMIPVVKDIVAVDTCNDDMIKLGYKPKGEHGILFRRFFSSSKFNIHVFEAGSTEIERHIKFRDWMRSNSEDAKKYEKLKLELTNLYPYDIYAYCAGKEDFILSIDAKAGWSGLRVVKVITPRELSAAKHFRRNYFFAPHGIEDPYTWTFNHEEHAHLVLYQGTEIVAYAHIQFWPDKRAAIRIIATDENKRNQSFGSRFLTLIEKWLKNLGVKSIHAESRQSSLRFYFKNGYTEMPFDDPGGNECGPPDVPVGKVL